MSLYVILMGVQGAGKGLQAKRIEERFGIPRADRCARKVQDIMASGQLVDDDTTNAIVADRLAQADAWNGVILDGYPRNEIQAAFLEAHLREKGARINAVLLLELNLYAAFKRAFGRVSASDGASYNYYFNADGVDFSWKPHEDNAFPPRLDASLAATGEALLRRPDDASADAIIQRIDTFLETTQPLIRYFEAQEILRKIDADQSIDLVWADIKRALSAV